MTSEISLQRLYLEIDDNLLDINVINHVFSHLFYGDNRDKDVIVPIRLIIYRLADCSRNIDGVLVVSRTTDNQHLDTVDDFAVFGIFRLDAAVLKCYKRLLDRCSYQRYNRLDVD